MINVNQITAQLAKMPDNALQQYATMHKDDPYTVSLALSESNRRKAMRLGAMAGGQQQQPTVVDQDIAGMAPPAQQPQHLLPEEQGIGQLPAQNMQKMAGGGIVAFDEGGEVPRYADRGLVYGQYGYGNKGAGQQYTPEQLQEAQRLRDMGLIDVLKEKFGPAWQALTTGPTPEIKRQTTIPTNAPDQSAAETARLTAQANPATPAMAAQPVPPQVQSQPPTQAPAQPTPGLPGLGGSNYEQKFLGALDKGETDKATRMKEVTDIDAPVLEKWKTMVDDQKAKLKSDKEENFYMSLIQGGLAAAGASGPNALQNLAQGFEKGASHYGEGLKDLRKAAQENEKMQISMAQYEATGKKDALKSYYDHADKVEGYKAAGLATIFGHQISAAGSVAAAGASANAQRNLMEALGNAPEGSALRKGFEMSKQEGRIPMMYDAYVKAASDPMKGEDFLRKYPNFQTYMAGMGGSGAGQFIQMPANAAPSTAVLPRKN